MGQETLENVIDVVATQLVSGHLRALHAQPLPMEEALARLRSAAPTASSTSSGAACP
jgi:hypothetical protein